MYWILTQILQDKDRNGTEHNQIFGLHEKGHFKIGFSERMKRGILKCHSISADRNQPKT